MILASPIRQPDKITEFKMNLRTLLLFLLSSTLQAAPFSMDSLLGGDASSRESAAKSAASLSENDRRALVQKLIQKLRPGNDVDQREHAAEALGYLGPQAKEAIPALRASLNDDFPYIRTRCAEALAKMGPDAVPTFITALSNANADVRSVAAGSLGTLGEDAASAAPALVKALGDSDSTVRNRAATALERLGASSVEPVAALLTDDRAALRLQALRILGAIETPAPILTDMASRLSDSDSQVRLAAMKALARKKATAVDPLLDLLRSPDPSLKARAAETLGDLGRSGGNAVPSLTEALKDEVPAVRANAAVALGKIGPDAVSSVPTLRELTKDSSPQVTASARDAIAALTATHQGPAPVQPGQLLGGIQSDPKVPDTPAPPLPKPISKPASLKIIKKKAPAGVTPQGLVRQLSDKNEAVRTNAEQMLLGMEGKAVPALTQALTSAPAPIRTQAARILGLLGAPSSSAVPKLSELVRGPNVDTRKEALSALIAIDPSATIAALATAAKEIDPAMRLWVTQQFEQMGPSAPAGTTVLIPLLEDPVVVVSTTAASALERIGTAEARQAVGPFRQKQLSKAIATLVEQLRKNGSAPNPQAVSDLVQLGGPAALSLGLALKDTQLGVRIGASQALNRLGREAAPAATSMVEALEDKDPHVRRNLGEALQKVDDPRYRWTVRIFRVKEKVRSLLPL